MIAINEANIRFKRTLLMKVCRHREQKDLFKTKEMHSVGFEPTSANTLELESSSLDRSDTNAWGFLSVLHYIKTKFIARKSNTFTFTIISSPYSHTRLGKGQVTPSLLLSLQNFHLLDSMLGQLKM